MDLRRQLATVRRWLPLLVASTALAAAAAFVFSSLQPKTYEAKATLVVGQSLSGVNPDYTQLLASQRLSGTYAAVATTQSTLSKVIGELRLDTTPDELAKQVTADSPTDSSLLMITAEDSDPARTAAIANAVAEELLATSPAIQGRTSELQASIDASLAATQAQMRATQARVEALSALDTLTSAQQAELATLEDRLASLRATYATLLAYSSANASNIITIIDPAVVPTSPVAPRPLLNTLLAAVLGLMIAVGIIAAAEYLGDAVKDPEDVESVTGLSTIGTIGRMRGEEGRAELYQLAALLQPRSGVTEAYRTLRSNVEFAAVDAPLRSLLVTSAMPAEGKTVTAANLAVVFAQAGRRVLLVDADLRQPGVHRIFDVANSHGLTTLLRREDVALDAVAHRTEQEGLRIVTTGPLPPNPAELLGSHRMRAVLERLGGDADLVIVDSPPLRAVADSAILSSFLDGTLLVIEAGRSRRRALRMAREALERAGAKVVGVVLNRVAPAGRAEYADYYGGDYEAGSGTARVGAEGAAGRSAG